jgi:hypothetical protein
MKMKMIVLIFKATQIHSEKNRMSIMTIINMKHVQNLPGRVVYNNPSRLAEVLPDKRKWLNKDEPELTDIIKAQVEKVREIFRILRSELYDPKRSDDSRIIKAGAFDGNITIEQHLLAVFPPKYSDVIRFACYIEENVNSFPEDPIKPWVTLRKSHVRNLIGNALSNGMDRYSVYTMLGTFLWAQLGESIEIDGTPGRIIQSYTVTKLYRSIGVSAKKVIDLWMNMGILKQHERSRPGFRYTVSSKVFIPDNNKVFQMTKSAPLFPTTKVRSDANLELIIRDDIIPKMNGYFFHYPVDSKGVFNERVPIIFSNDETVTIPLVENISPAVIAALFTIPELVGLLSHLKANQRSNYISTVMKHASESVDLMNESLLRFNREKHRINLTYLDNRDTFHRIITGMSVSGVSVDEGLLIKFDLHALITKQSSRQNAEEEREKILKQISMTNGVLHSQYHLKSRTERIYTRNYNIQGLPKVFHGVILPDPGNRFIYFDIVANDLTMLFNMIGDQQGLKMLKASKDPYHEIATEAFGDGSQRERVKAFVSPYLYGAANKTIITNSRDKLVEQDIILLKTAMTSLFPESSDWLSRIKSSAEAGLIPRKFNPIDSIDIPIPKAIGTTVGPAMIIQRYGARLFRAIICALSRIGYDPKVFVHDSLLIQVPESANIDEAMLEVMEQINLTRYSRGLRALAIKIGWGESWKAAVNNAKYEGMYD